MHDDAFFSEWFVVVLLGVTLAAHYAGQAYHTDLEKLSGKFPLLSEIAEKTLGATILVSVDANGNFMLDCGMFLCRLQCAEACSLFFAQQN